MPVNPLKIHTYSVRRPKSELQLLRELARRLGKTPGRLISEAFERRLPSLIKKAGLVEASADSQ